MRVGLLEQLWTPSTKNHYQRITHSDLHQTYCFHLTKPQVVEKRGERVSMAAAEAIVDLMEGRRPKLLVNPEILDQPQLRAKLNEL